MKHVPSVPRKFKLLPIVFATSITLIGCDADPTGEINGGLDGGIGGIGTANSVLLAGGIIGLGAILADSGSDPEGPTVGVESGDGDSNGDDSGNGGDNNGDGSGNGGDNNGDGTGNGGDTNGDGTGNGGDTNGDGTGNGGDTNGDGTGNGGDTNGDGSSNGGDNSGDGSDNSGDGTGNGSSTGGGDDAAEGLFQPPAWMTGMWTGTSASGEQRVAFATETDIGVGSPDNVQSYSAIAGIEVQELQNTGSVYEYSVSYNSATKGPVSFTEKWTNNSDGTVLYSVTGDVVDEFIMYQVPATDFLKPPQWMQGDWAGNDYRASVSAGNISFGPIGSAATNLYQTASAPGTVVRVTTSTSADYRFQITSIGSDGDATSVDYSFGIFDNNSIAFTSSALKSTVVMIRQ